MIFLGIDVGFNNTGIVVYDSVLRSIVRTELITTSKETEERGISVAQDNARRIRHISKQIRLLLLNYRKGTIERAYFEMPHGGAKSSRAMSAMCYSAATVVSTLDCLGIRSSLVTPLQVKRLVKSKGSVEKDEVQSYVAKKFGSNFLPRQKGKAEHIADAAGALLVGLKLRL